MRTPLVLVGPVFITSWPCCVRLSVPYPDRPSRHPRIISTTLNEMLDNELNATTSREKRRARSWKIRTRSTQPNAKIIITGRYTILEMSTCFYHSWPVDKTEWNGRTCSTSGIYSVCIGLASFSQLSIKRNLQLIDWLRAFLWNATARPTGVFFFSFFFFSFVSLNSYPGHRFSLFLLFLFFFSFSSASLNFLF